MAINPEMAFNFLLTENELRQSSLSLMVAQLKWVQFLDIVSRWSLNNKEYIDKKTLEIDQNEFQHRQISDKFTNFFRTLLLKASKEENSEALPKII